MSTFLKASFSVVWTIGIAAQAQETAPGNGSAPAGTGASVSQAEMQKWLADLDGQWVGSLVRDVTGPADAEMARIRQKYAAVIEANLAKASAAAELEAAVAWRAEKANFAATQKAPVAGDDPKLPSAVRQFRSEWRAEEAKVTKDRMDKTKALLARFDTVLSQAQTLLTQRARLDDAVLVKTMREEVAARWLSGSPGAASRKTAAVAPPEKTPAERAMPSFATIELEEGNFLPLVKGERIWSDRNTHITTFSPTFDGLGFTQHKAHGLTLKFKVVNDGLLYLGCSARWGTTAAPEVAKDFITEEKLLAAGWVRQPNDEIVTEASDMLFLTYSRRCKAGEEFSYRTEKYAPPILLWK